ncbi:hypothetical protein N7457_007476 [Penicillium paradoxum]|uniref:uncharacterized protein n=1 Tax=Penicillium paradoxum TaxID=176176 RepID=UPI002548056C|nr:uncharacterized protein N7457_007476 [Penicillium paradoxum]KAJ5779756.1 hypothetical protein N7457_007476 [Penicillium paradoxum]
MEECENAAGVGEEQRLSGRMRESWESGDFWIMYAVAHSLAFDAICWQKIDPRFYGSTTENTEGLCLLDVKEKDEMELLVACKLKEKATRVLAWGPDEYTMAFRQQLDEERGKDEEKGFS